MLALLVVHTVGNHSEGSLVVECVRNFYPEVVQLSIAIGKVLIIVIFPIVII